MIIWVPTIFQTRAESIASHRNINFPSTLSAVLTSIRIFKYFFPNSPSFKVWLYRFHLPLKRQSCCQRISKVSKNQSLRIKISIFNLQIFLFRIVHQWKLGPTFPIYLCNDNPGADMIFFFQNRPKSIKSASICPLFQITFLSLRIQSEYSKTFQTFRGFILIFISYFWLPFRFPNPKQKQNTKLKSETNRMNIKSSSSLFRLIHGAGASSHFSYI